MMSEEITYPATDEEHPTLNFQDPMDGENIEIAFGYMKGEATAVLYKGGDGDPMMMIPRDALLIAVDQGWGDEFKNESRGAGGFAITLSDEDVESLNMIVGNDLDNQWDICRGDPDPDERRRHVQSMNLGGELDAQMQLSTDSGKPLVFQFSGDSMELIGDLVESWSDCYSLDAAVDRDDEEKEEVGAYLSLKSAVDAARRVERFDLCRP